MVQRACMPGSLAMSFFSSLQLVPFSSAKERLETYLKKSATLKSQLKKWGEALDKEFTDAMKLAKDSL